MSDAQLNTFGDLLSAARRQAEPQRLLFVFAERYLDADASSVQRRRFALGDGGHVRPSLCVDRAPGDIADFGALVAESRKAGKPWDIVFVSSVGGAGGVPPERERGLASLKLMVNAIKGGRLNNMVVFDRAGNATRCFCG